LSIMNRTSTNQPALSNMAKTNATKTEYLKIKKSLRAVECTLENGTRRSSVEKEEEPKFLNKASYMKGFGGVEKPRVEEG
jgi:hypothetical protein